MTYTKEQQELIKAFIENEAMAAAVRAALLEQVSPGGIHAFVVGLDRAKPDAEFGQAVKARAEAADILEKGFAHLKQLASAKQGVQSQQNPAR